MQSPSSDQHKHILLPMDVLIVCHFAISQYLNSPPTFLALNLVVVQTSVVRISKFDNPIRSEKFQ